MVIIIYKIMTQSMILFVLIVTGNDYDARGYDDYDISAIILQLFSNISIRSITNCRLLKY